MHFKIEWLCMSDRWVSKLMSDEPINYGNPLRCNSGWLSLWLSRFAVGHWCPFAAALPPRVGSDLSDWVGRISVRQDRQFVVVGTLNPSSQLFLRTWLVKFYRTYDNKFSLSSCYRNSLMLLLRWKRGCLVYLILSSLFRWESVVARYPLDLC